MKQAAGKTILTDAAACLYAVGCGLFGVFYLNFGFWKDDCTQLAGGVLMVLTCLMLLGFLQMRVWRKPVGAMLFKGCAVCTAVILGAACLLWGLYHGQRYSLFSARYTLSLSGMALHLGVLLIGVYSIKQR